MLVVSRISSPIWRVYVLSYQLRTPGRILKYSYSFVGYAVGSDTQSRASQVNPLVRFRHPDDVIPTQGLIGPDGQSMRGR